MNKTPDYIQAAVEALTTERGGVAPKLSGPDSATVTNDWRAVTHRSVDLALDDAQKEHQQLTAAIDYAAGLGPLPVARETEQRARELVSEAAQRLGLGGAGRSGGIGVMIRLGHVPSFEHEEWFRIAVAATEQALMQKHD